MEALFDGFCGRVERRLGFFAGHHKQRGFVGGAHGHDGVRQRLPGAIDNLPAGGLEDAESKFVIDVELPRISSRLAGGSSFGGGGGAAVAASAVFGTAFGALIAGGVASGLLEETGISGRTARLLMMGALDFALALVTLGGGSLLLVTAGSAFGGASLAGFAAGCLGAAGVLGMISAILSFSTRT